MKPSYEDLEEQLNISRRLCDAALANERVWETAMMQACGEDGPKSVAEKFAALEARCAALAAENAGLKAVIAENWNMRDVLRQLVSARPGGVYFNKWEPVILKALNETPETDTFLAEVRASALDEFAKAQDEQAKKYYEMSPGCTAQDECQFAASQAWYFAECIRKGVQS